MLADAMINIKTIVNNITVFPLKSISIIKLHGQGLLDSKLVNGIAIEARRASLLMPLMITKAKIACIDMNISKFRAPLGVQILINDPINIEKIRKRYYYLINYIIVLLESLK